MDSIDDQDQSHNYSVFKVRPNYSKQVWNELSFYSIELTY